MKSKLIYNSKDVEWVDINSIKANNYNPNFMPSDLMEALKKDIHARGLEYPVIIRKDNQEIIDGWHRWTCCKSLGWNQIPITRRDVNDAEAMIRTLRINRERGHLLPNETGSLLKHLSESIPTDKLPVVTAMPSADIAILMDLSYDPDIIPEDTATSNLTTWTEIDSACGSIVKELKDGKIQVTSIHAVGMGGLVPARLLADRLNISKVNVNSKNYPAGSLIVDACYDTGSTFTKEMKKAKSTKTVTYAVICLKGDEERKLPSNLIYAFPDDSPERLILPWEKFDNRREQ